MATPRRSRSKIAEAVARLADGSDGGAELEACVDDLDERDVVAIAESRQASEDVIRAVCNNAKLTKAYAVKLALVQNKKTPFALVARWLPLMRQSDLKALAAKPRPPDNGGGSDGGSGAPAHAGVSGRWR